MKLMDVNTNGHSYYCAGLTLHASHAHNAQHGYLRERHR